MKKTVLLLTLTCLTLLTLLTSCSKADKQDTTENPTDTCYAEEEQTGGSDGNINLNLDVNLQKDSAETYNSGGREVVTVYRYEYITVYQPVEQPETPTSKPEEVTQPTQPINNTPQTSGQQLSYQSLGNGTCKLIGTGSCNDACIVIPECNQSGETVVSIGEKAFYENQTVTAIQIPSTVSSIGELAFASCTNLAYISVNAASQYFKTSGGALYSKDGRTLIVYPPASTATYCTVPAGVTSISQMAFYGCKSLKYISFGGTQAEWASINIGAYNYSLTSAAVYCSDNGK